MRGGNLCHIGWVAHHAPNPPGHVLDRATCSRKSRSERNGSGWEQRGNLKRIKTSSKKAKESCTDKGTMVANTSHPDILRFTQSYTGGNEKKESPYGGEYCLCSMPGMVTKLRSTKRKHCHHIICFVVTPWHTQCVQKQERNRA